MKKFEEALPSSCGEVGHLMTHREEGLPVGEVETDLYFYLPKEENRRV